MKKKIILTKNRLNALENALSFDDILFEKFKRLDRQLKDDIKKWNKQKQVIEVIKNESNRAYRLQILDEIKTPEGIILRVR